MSDFSQRFAFETIPNPESPIDQYRLIGSSNPVIAIQINRDFAKPIYLVNEYGQADPSNPDTLYFRHHAPFQDLDAAMGFALSIHNLRQMG